MTIEEIKELLQIFNESGVAELELQRGENRLRLRRASLNQDYILPPAAPVAPVMVSAAPVAYPQMPPPAMPAPSATASMTPKAPDIDSGHVHVKSPIVGTYYDAPAPGAPSFVKVGDAVEPGQVLCIIESMKLMNEIESEVAGVVAAKLVENGRAGRIWRSSVRHPPPLTPMFEKILIANRGEIALRVICACKDLGIRTVAVYSEADRHSLHARFADQAMCIGPAKSARSYLDIPSVISAAEITNADAVHPGYGFLSENADFAEVCETSGLRFIGPAPDVIRRMGLKQMARTAMEEADVPILPGSKGILKSLEEAIELAGEIGYPVMLKASAGGGGRGMRVVRRAEDMPHLLAQAQAEASAAFSSGDMYMEKLVENPRHIEFQVLGDEHGNVEILGERECSIQRRHQKLIEESPSTAVTPELRARISEKLRVALKAIGYTNAGTVEFLMDADRNLYFIEVNARIQVEHPVTEMVTGVDLVKSQIRIAAGEKLSDILRGPVELRGHAIECRINAEHPETFTPSPGRITGLNLPGGAGIRVDTAAYHDGVIPPYYDSLVAKLIAHGADRSEAIARMSRALGMFVVEGIYTSIPLDQRILAHPDFIAGNIDTGFLARAGFICEKK